MKKKTKTLASCFAKASFFAYIPFGIGYLAYINFPVGTFFFFLWVVYLTWVQMGSLK